MHSFLIDIMSIRKKVFKRPQSEVVYGVLFMHKWSTSQISEGMHHLYSTLWKVSHNTGISSTLWLTSKKEPSAKEECYTGYTNPEDSIF